MVLKAHIGEPVKFRQKWHFEHLYFLCRNFRAICWKSHCPIATFLTHNAADYCNY